MNTYCNYINSLKSEESVLHKKYHDTEYGFPLSDDNLLFERLMLEINQAGLSWITILNKQKNFQKAYDNFDLVKIANYSEQDRQRLLNDAGIIRNRLKVNAAIENAKRIIQIQKDFGSFLNWLDKHRGLSREEWTKVFKQTFVFTGGEIVNEFLLSTGYLPGAHSPDCQIYSKIVAQAGRQATRLDLSQQAAKRSQ